MNIYREGEKEAFFFPQSKCLRGFSEIEHRKIEGSGRYWKVYTASESIFQHAFRGSNYPHLLNIKRKFDPDDVFWCTPCVGDGKKLGICCTELTIANDEVMQAAKQFHLSLHNLLFPCLFI